MQKKSVKIMFFQSRNSHTGPLFKNSKILESFDKTALENCIFISITLRGCHHLFLLAGSVAGLIAESHSYNTRWENLGYLTIPSYQTETYRRYLMATNAIYVWRYLQSSHHNVIFHQLSINKLKEILLLFFPQQI